MDICKKHGVYVISDEIHQDLVMKGHSHIPTATAGDYDEILVTLTAATKTFNLAACQNSIVILPDSGLRSAMMPIQTGSGSKGAIPLGMWRYKALMKAEQTGLQRCWRLLKTITTV